MLSTPLASTAFYNRPAALGLGLLALATSALTLADQGAEDRNLTVYTYSSFNTEWGPGPQIKDAFMEQCDCTLKFVSAEDGVSLMNRLRLEGSNTPADVVVGLDNALMAEARSYDLFQPHDIDLDSLPLQPDLAWDNPVYVPFDYGYFAFIYNSDQTPEPAGSLQELLASDADLIYMDPRTSTVGLGLMHWIQAVYTEPAQASAAWSRLADQTVTVTSGWSEGYNMFLAGEADYVISYTSSPAYHQVAENDERYQAAIFDEGHVPQIEVAAMSRYSTEPELAGQFLEFLMGPEAQAILPVTNWMLPVRTGVDLPPAFHDRAPVKRIGYDSATIAAERDTWIRRWRDGVTR